MPDIRTSICWPNIWLSSKLHTLAYQSFPFRFWDRGGLSDSRYFQEHIKFEQIHDFKALFSSLYLGDDQIGVLRNQNQNRMLRVWFRFFSTRTRISKSQFLFLLTGTGILKCQSFFLSTENGISANTGIPAKNLILAYPLPTLHPKSRIFYTFILFWVLL